MFMLLWFNKTNFCYIQCTAALNNVFTLILQLKICSRLESVRFYTFDRQVKKMCPRTTMAAIVVNQLHFQKVGCKMDTRIVRLLEKLYVCRVSIIVRSLNVLTCMVLLTLSKDNLCMFQSIDRNLLSSKICSFSAAFTLNSSSPQWSNWVEPIHHRKTINIEIYILQALSKQQYHRETTLLNCVTL